LENPCECGIEPPGPISQGVSWTIPASRKMISPRTKPSTIVREPVMPLL
jgi:hypothetical protein